jgi:hypothetical protein
MAVDIDGLKHFKNICAATFYRRVSGTVRADHNVFIHGRFPSRKVDPGKFPALVTGTTLQRVSVRSASETNVPPDGAAGE